MTPLFAVKEVSPFELYELCQIPLQRYIPVDTGHKLNVCKTFRRRPGRLLNVLCTLNLRLVSTGILGLPVKIFCDVS